MTAGTKALSIVLAVNRSSSDGTLKFDISNELTRGPDFKVYPNRGYTKDPRDSDLLEAFMSRLIGKHAITVFDVTPTGLYVHVNRTVIVGDVVADIIAAARGIGYKVDYQDHTC